MSLPLVLAAALAAGAPPAGACAPAPPAPQTSVPAPGPAPSASVTSYRPDYFAATQPNTAFDMVNRLPGFALDLGDQVRGLAGSAGNVLIDGERPATKTDALDEILKRIPAREVERIDLIRGGAPGIDMQGKTVIANVIRKADNGLKLTTAVAGSYALDGHYEPAMRLEGTKRSGATQFEGSLLLSRGADDGTGNGRRVVTDGAGHVIQTGFERAFGEQVFDKGEGAVETPVLGGKLRVEGTVAIQPYRYHDNDTLIAPPGREFEVYRQAPDTAELGARYTHPLGAKASVEVYLLQQIGWASYSDDFTTAANHQLYGQRRRSGESIGRTVFKLSPAARLSLEAGAEGDFNWLRSRTSFTDNGAPVLLPAANVEVEELRGEVFATAVWQARPNITVESGLRLEASQITSKGDVVATDRFFFPKPRLLATWSADSADQVRFRIEREVGQLNFDDFTSSGAQGTGGNNEHGGNPQLAPQHDWVVEAGIERRFWGGADISLTARRYWIDNVLDRAAACAVAATGPCDPVQEFDAPANIGPGSKDELALNLTLPTDKLGLKRGLLTARSTWRWSSVIDPSTHRQREISALHPLDAEMHFTQGLPRLKSTWGFDLYWHWRQTYYRFNEIDTDENHSYLALFAEYRPRPDFTLRLEVDNATYRGFEHIRAFYAPTRDAPDPALAATDHRYPHFPPIIYLRARKTFG